METCSAVSDSQSVQSEGYGSLSAVVYMCTVSQSVERKQEVPEKCGRTDSLNSEDFRMAHGKSWAHPMDIEANCFEQNSSK